MPLLGERYMEDDRLMPPSDPRNPYSCYDQCIEPCLSGCRCPAVVIVTSVLALSVLPAIGSMLGATVLNSPMMARGLGVIGIFSIPLSVLLCVQRAMWTGNPDNRRNEGIRLASWSSVSPWKQNTVMIINAVGFGLCITGIAMGGPIDYPAGGNHQRL